MFSPAFQSMLDNTAITVDKAFSMFETYVLNPENAIKGMTIHKLFIYEIPAVISTSPVYSEFLDRIKKNLEATGFVEKQNFTSIYDANPTEFAFLKKNPPSCSFNCQKDGCYTTYSQCQWNNTACVKILICL
jgi:hypothetical protein